MHFEMVDCPKCKRIIEVRILGITSGLGPPFVHCGSCATVIPLKRREWENFDWKDRIWFLIVSVGEIAFLALLLGIAGGMSFPVQGVPWEQRVVDENIGFPVGIGVGVLVGVFIQLKRVIDSKTRGRLSARNLITQSWAEVQTNVQLKVCSLVLLIGVVGTTVNYFLSQ